MGLSREETSKAWEDIQLYWNIIKGEEKGDIEKAKREINKIQILLEIEVTDFSKEPEIKETPTQELQEYTIAQAEEILGEENIKIIEKGLDFAIAYNVIARDITEKKYPKLKGNHAGLGQMVNISYDQVKDKLK